ncbi:MAG: CBS domain-containing protein [Planctomycetota bacterium]
MMIPHELQLVAQKVGDGDSVSVTVRRLLSWFGHARRGRLVVRSVRRALTRVGLQTLPRLDALSLDEPIVLVPTSPSKPPGVVAAGAHRETKKAVEKKIDSTLHDPAYRIGRLAAASRPPQSIGPDEPLSKAMTIMMQEGFSQLPVMTGKRTVIGVITFKSIASRWAFDKTADRVKDCLDRDVPIVAESLPLFRAIDLVGRDGFVLVRGKDNTIQGIVTSSDVTETVLEVARPYMLLREIEEQIRILIAGGRFTAAELAAMRTDADQWRAVEKVEHLTLGQCVRLLENRDNWQRIGLAIDRSEFVKKLHVVVRIRNRVMHFAADGLSAAELDLLKKTARFFRDLGNMRGGRGTIAKRGPGPDVPPALSA